MTMIRNDRRTHRIPGLVRRGVAVCGVTVLLMGMSVTTQMTVSSAEMEVHPPKRVKDPLVAVSVIADGKETDYRDIGGAMEAASGKSKPVIKLYKSIELSSTLVFGGDQSSTILDMNGYDLIRKGADKSKNGAVISIESGAGLTIINNALATAHIKNGSSSNSAGGIQVNNGATLSVNNITICDINNDYEGAALFNDGGDVRLNGVTIQRCTSEEDGGAIYHKSGSLHITDCLISDNSSDGDGGGIAIDGENVEIYNTEIYRNTAADDGGGIWVNNHKVFLCGGEIRGNIADYGGGVYVDSMYDVNIQGRLVIQENQTTSNEPSNLVLQDGVASSARAYDGGLLPGSKIGINKTGGLGNGYKAVIGVTDYEIDNGYFVADRGKVKLGDTSTKKELFMATAVSKFGWGIVPLIVLELIGAGCVMYSIRKKKKRSKQ